MNHDGLSSTSEDDGQVYEYEIVYNNTSPSIIKPGATKEQIHKILQEHGLEVTIDEIISMDRQTFLDYRKSSWHGFNNVQKSLLSEVRTKVLDRIRKGRIRQKIKQAQMNLQMLNCDYEKAINSSNANTSDDESYNPNSSSSSATIPQKNQQQMIINPISSDDKGNNIVEVPKQFVDQKQHKIKWGATEEELQHALYQCGIRIEIDELVKLDHIALSVYKTNNGLSQLQKELLDEVRYKVRARQKNKKQYAKRRKSIQEKENSNSSEERPKFKRAKEADKIIHATPTSHCSTNPNTKSVTKPCPPKNASGFAYKSCPPKTAISKENSQSLSDLPLLLDVHEPSLSKSLPKLSSSIASPETSNYHCSSSSDSDPNVTMESYSPISSPTSADIPNSSTWFTTKENTPVQSSSNLAFTEFINKKIQAISTISDYFQAKQEKLKHRPFTCYDSSEDEIEDFESDEEMPEDEEELGSDEQTEENMYENEEIEYTSEIDEESEFFEDEEDDENDDENQEFSAYNMVFEKPTHEVKSILKKKRVSFNIPSGLENEENIERTEVLSEPAQAASLDTTKHPISKPFKCSFCDKTFKFRRMLIDHEKKHENRLKEASKNEKVSDSKILTQVNNERVPHEIQKMREEILMKMNSNGSTKTAIQIPTKTPNNPTENLERPFKCTFCEKSFKCKDHLRIHERIHTGERPYDCEFCDNKFKQRPHLIQHLRRFHANKKPLDHKSKVRSAAAFRFQDTQNNPSRNPERPFICIYCEQSFKRPEHLQFHERIHTGEKPYECKFCVKRFTQQSQLDQHLRIHTNEKPYQCRFCDKMFKQQCHLDQHERIHKNEKPYECSQCDQKFFQKSGLNLHIGTHHSEQLSQKRPYKCAICVQSYKRYKDLKFHMLKHPNNQDGLFKYSLFGNNRKADLEEHLNKNHGVLTDQDKNM